MDERLFISEYKRVSDQLYTFLVRTVGDRDLASDLLQEAAYRAFRSRRQFRGDSSFKTWIYRIAVNMMKDHWVRAKRESTWLDTPMEADNPSGLTPEHLAAGKESALELSRALMLVEESYRIPFMLKHIDGLSYREISQILGIQESAARVRVYRARGTLRMMLRKDEP